MQLQVLFEHDIPINAFYWTPMPYKEPLHYHHCLEIGCCVKGEGTFYFGEKSYSVTPGDIVIVNHKALHIACSDEQNPSQYLFIKFDPSLLLAEDERLLLPFSYPTEWFQHHIPSGTDLAQALQPIMESMRRELNEKQEGYQMMAKGSLLLICSHLLRHYSSVLPSAQWKQLAESFLQIRTVVAYMEENFREPLELKLLTPLFQLSPSRVSRLFREVLGRGFKDHLALLRLNEAKRLLICTDMPVTELCFASGFQSLPSFYRIFVKSEGLSPIEYRNKYYGVAIFENRTD